MRSRWGSSGSDDAANRGMLDRCCHDRNRRRNSLLTGRVGWQDEIGGLDEAIYSAVAATPTPALDRYFRGLSRAADHSALWVVAPPRWPPRVAGRDSAPPSTAWRRSPSPRRRPTCCSSRSSGVVGPIAGLTMFRWPAVWRCPAPRRFLPATRRRPSRSPRASELHCLGPGFHLPPPRRSWLTRGSTPACITRAT